MYSHRARLSQVVIRSESMLHGTRLFAAVALAAALSPSTRAEVRTGEFLSESLGKTVSYVVDLPPGYDQGRERYPVVYALHGMFESQAFWEKRGLAQSLASLRDEGKVPPFLVVAVNGGNTLFANHEAGRFQDMVTKDLVAHIEATWRVKSGRASRGLLGISMGGHAALRIAFAEPEAFGAVATHSAMLLDRIPSREEGADAWHMRVLEAVFGAPIDTERWNAADPLVLALRCDKGKVPALRFDCGREDRYGLAKGNTMLHEMLEKRGVPHTFALEPGNHGYEYVRTVLPESLRFLAQALATN
jgi:enterochelin esterase-like enzyme